MSEFFDMDFGPLTGLAAASFMAVFVGVAIAIGIARTLLLRWQILDVPNERSSHDRPTPRGGGIGVLAVLLPVWIYWLSLIMDSGPLTGIGGAALLLAAISWIDDLKGLGAPVRLGVHVIAAGAAVWALPGPIFGGLLPQLADAAVAVLLLVWFINLFNFMDGIDAISGVETLVIGAGVGAVALISPNLAGIAIPGLLLAAAALGFLVWNWPRARIFLGDVGSAPLGLLLGWLLLALASQGLWLSAIILPLYYLADSGLTLMRRLMRGENITVAHRSHFYQKAVQRGRGHATVSFAVMAIGIVLVAHAAVAARLDAAIAWPALISAGAFVGLLLAWMASPARRN